MSHQNNNKDRFDIFVLDSIFPEAPAIFSWRPRPLESIKEECVVVLDTNSLLVPYTVSAKSLDEIGRTYTLLADQERLVVPGRVAREFATNRANKLAELYQSLNTRRSQAKNVQSGRYPLLESLEEYQETLQLEKDIDDLLKKYRKTISRVADHVRQWNWNDPVSLMYSSLFDNKVIVDPNFSHADIEKDLLRRHTHKIPPGYKDASKDDRGVGDLLIWRTLLEIGKNRQKSVVFVSNDEKPDWWHQSDGGALYPRYELTDEYRRHSGGQSLHILKFSSFLDLYGAGEEVVEEVRREETISVRASNNAILLPTGPILVVRYDGKYGAVKALEQTSHEAGAHILYSWWYQPNGSSSFTNASVQTGHGKTWEEGYGNPPKSGGPWPTLQIGPIALEWSVSGPGSGWVYFGPPAAHSSQYELAVSDETDIWKVDVSRLMFASIT